MTKKEKHNKPRLKLRLKAWKNGKMMVDTTRSSKQRLRGIIRSQKGIDRYYLKVTYGKGLTNTGVEEIYNDGEYFNKKDLLTAFSIFTSKDEINDFFENFSITKGGRGL